jgi:hypothetical protein
MLPVGEVGVPATVAVKVMVLPTTTARESGAEESIVTSTPGRFPKAKKVPPLSV